MTKGRYIHALWLLAGGDGGGGGGDGVGTAP